MNVAEGCASMADSSGTLLFYTDGMTVWTANNMVMANGTGLIGNGTANQAVLTLKKPGNANLYYIFTEGGLGTGKLAYSIIDMSLAAGMGSVTVKNFTLSANMTEKLTATKHCNGNDYWIVGHRMNSDEFLAYELNSSGVNTVAIVSACGTQHSNNTNTTSPYVAGGGMKLSPNGRKLAVCLYSPINQVELYDFNPLTGIVSNSLILGTYSLPYSCEFSSDCTKLYATCYENLPSTLFRGLIVQWDLCTTSSSAIPATQSVIGSDTNIVLSALQIANDNKIYVARPNNQPYLGIINNPNIAGISCNYVAVGQSLTPSAVSAGGLPNFSSDWFREKPVFTRSLNCASASFTAPQFCAGTGYSVTGYSWSFGDPASGAANTSSLANPLHTYSSGGTFTTQLILQYYGCGTDTLKQIINSGLPVISLTGKTTLCNKENILLTASGASTYSWSNGATTSSTVLSPTITTIYTVTGTYSSTGCSSNKSVTLTVLPCTGIYEKNISTKAITVYPNPNDGNFKVKGFHTSVQLNFYNQLGEKIYTELVSNPAQNINMSYLESGIYYIEMISNGNRSVSKFVKQ